MKSFVLRGDGPAERAIRFINNNWRACARQGKPLAVTVAYHSDKRTIAQNAKLHALLTEISDKCDDPRMPMEAWKTYYKTLFLPHAEYIAPGGVVVSVPISTTAMTVADMSDFINNIMADAATELGLDLEDQWHE